MLLTLGVGSARVCACTCKVEIDEGSTNHAHNRYCETDEYQSCTQNENEFDQYSLIACLSDEYHSGAYCYSAGLSDVTVQ